MMVGRLGEALLREHLVSEQKLEECVSIHRQSGRRLLEVIVAEKAIDEQSLITFLSKQYRLTVMDLSSFELEENIRNLLPPNLCARNHVVPVGKRGDTLVVAVYDPTNIQMIDEIRFQTRLRVEMVLALPSVILSLVERHYGERVTQLLESMGFGDEAAGAVIENTQIDENQGELGPDAAPIIKYVTEIMVDAIRKKASDIHIESYEKDLRVRFRIDGDLIEAVKPPGQVKNALVARIKVMAKMRIDERRLPQDGRIKFKLPEGTVDFRVNSLPTIYGEKIVLRILDRTGAIVAIDDLGMEKDDLEKFKKALANPWGMALVTGATGSGKTTTLYSAIQHLNKVDVNISTIEDPVEYNFHGINQTQVKDQIGLTFGETLRALLRQDPDIILLGEIRDGETATIAMKAALTGHLVLSTLHTNDAPSTIMRLKDMGLDTFLINSALLVIIAQRLVRRVCTKCKSDDTRYTDEMLKQIGFPENVIGKFKPQRGTGCPECRNTGFRGRCAIHEVMYLSETLKEKIGTGATTAEIRKLAQQEGMRTLRVNCMRKIIRGIVAIDDLTSAN